MKSNNPTRYQARNQASKSQESLQYASRKGSHQKARIHANNKSRKQTNGKASKQARFVIDCLQMLKQQGNEAENKNNNVANQ